MIEIGQYTTLEVVKKTDFGVYLDGGPFGEVLLPKRYVPEGLEPGQDVTVFLYCDSEDRIIATTEKPYAVVDEIAYLKVTDTAEHGAFMDWGLMKDLFIPFREQKVRMEKGKSYLVKILLDSATDRIYASSKIYKYLLETTDGLLEKNQEVQMMVIDKTDLGYKMALNNRYIAMLFKNEAFQALKIGEILRGYVKQIREDGKIDVMLKKQGFLNQIQDDTAIIRSKLAENDGYLPITDSSPPEVIYDTFSMSKKSFKKAIGNLYKEKILSLEKEGIRLIVTG
jgi:uncharacterized protein